MRKIKRFLKILAWLFGIGLLLLYGVFYYFTTPKSDKKILAKFENATVKPVISHEVFKGFDYRKITIHKNDSLPTIVFVHGTIGSCIDFAKYMQDATLSKKANFISYDRIGYNYKDANNVQESIAFEVEMLQNITKNLPKEKTIVVGYSYGGPIVLADTTRYKKIIVLAPAVYSKVEPMPWMLNFYKWKITRWLVPNIWKQASREKLSHKKDVRNFEENWTKNPNTIIDIHGDNDGIVPYASSIYLLHQFPANRFKLITIANAGHGLVWSEFSTIKKEILKQLN
ncbi:MAG: alpha/beta fold hydrolase [Polaribacter sp.]